MKWGVRKSKPKNGGNPKSKSKIKYNKQQLKEDAKYFRSDGYTGYFKSRSIAKSTQKRMAKKGESRSVARRKAYNKRALTEFGVGVGAIAVTALVLNPTVRGHLNNAAWDTGRKVGQVRNTASRVASKISKTMDSNLITVSPISSARGRSVVGLLLDKN